MNVGRLLPIVCIVSACSSDANRAEQGLQKVLLAVIDATHAAHLSCYGNSVRTTPVIDELADEAVRFSRAFSNNTWTLASTASLLTGQLQETHGAVTNRHRLPDAASTAAEIFADAGWKTAAFVQMGFASQQFGMGQGFDEFVYYGSSDEAKASRVVPEAAEWIESSADAPWFVYLHLRRPHSPYRPNARTLERLDPDCPLSDGSRNEELASADQFSPRELPEEELDHLRHLYEGNLSMADSLLKPIVGRARKQGALVVVTSDHGEALGRRGVFGHGPYLSAENIDVPLVFWWPDATPRVDDGPACTVDVLPTLLELCGIDPPPGVRFDGRSLAGRLLGRSGSEDVPVMISARFNRGVESRVGVVEGDWKLVYLAPDQVHLYDRREDPGETVDRAPDRADVVQRLMPIAARWREAHADLVDRGILLEEIDPALQADLQALGYAE